MNEPTLPLASICIPTYNRAGQLEQALTSAMRQDYDNLEIIGGVSGLIPGRG